MDITISVQHLFGQYEKSFTTTKWFYWCDKVAHQTSIWALGNQQISITQTKYHIPSISFMLRKYSIIICGCYHFKRHTHTHISNSLHSIYMQVSFLLRHCYSIQCVSQRPHVFNYFPYWYSHYLMLTIQYSPFGFDVKLAVDCQWMFIQFVFDWIAWLICYLFKLWIGNHGHWNEAQKLPYVLGAFTLSMAFSCWVLRTVNFSCLIECMRLSSFSFNR